MKIHLMRALFVCLLAMLAVNLCAQEEQVGAWYMYFFDKNPDKGTIAYQGDVQFRNWDLGADLEQLLLRAGLTYRPKGTDVKLTAGMGHITSGAYGESNATSEEFRIYQEALLPHAISKRIKLTHRFRYEQRFVQDQDLRTRYRYNLFLTVALNNTEGIKGSIYTSLYNELFINGQKQIGEGRSVARFDRDRFYLALGYGVSDKLKMQLGVMRQSLNSIRKDQLQLSLHHQL